MIKQSRKWASNAGLQRNYLFIRYYCHLLGSSENSIQPLILKENIFIFHHQKYEKEVMFIKMNAGNIIVEKAKLTYSKFCPVHPVLLLKN